MNRLILSVFALVIVMPAAGDEPAWAQRMDEVVQQGIERGDCPGAVILVLHEGNVVFRKAYGSRSLQPTRTPMSVDTVFDMASLTKPIATATSIMLLVEQGKLRLGDRVVQHLSAFGKNGKDQITIEQLLLHTSGLIADNSEKDYRDGRDKALERINDLSLPAEPGARFTYSDVGYIVLGELVERLSGKSLEVFARENIFSPLGMKETGFRPTLPRERFAPAQQRNGAWMLGEVHDPRSYLLGGVAGHAGLFATADDLAIYARMLLAGGTHQGKPILSGPTVRLMTTPRPVPGGLRAYGWDVDTSYSSNRGELFPRGESFGHTGFTGTSIWLDPGSNTAVIFLSNRVHPAGKGNVTRLRGQVATIAAAVSGRQRAAGRGQQAEVGVQQVRLRPVATGIDVLVAEKFQRLRGHHVALVTNHTGVDRQGRPTIDLLHQAEGVKLLALFSPEHGIRGAVDARVADSRDEKTGLPIYSLYGERRKPSPETLEGIDTLVFDIQDAGCRFYTYSSTLGNVLEAAAESKARGKPIKVVVLDRPNPIGGVAVEGPILDAGRESFVAYHTIPVRHGLTVGELALLFNAERKIGADLDVVRMKGWQRGDFYDRSGLTWINPSPNLRSLTEALLYPGIGLLETTNLSVGRGTDRPFEWIGAPWLDGRKLAEGLARHALPGVRFVPTRQTPSSSVFRGQACDGVAIIIDNWSSYLTLRTGIAIAFELRRLYPDTWKVDAYDRLLGNKQTLEALKKGQRWQQIEQSWQPGVQQFVERRRAFLLYPE